MPARSMSAIAGLDVEAARAHLVEAGRLHAPLLAGPAHHGVEPDVGVVVPLEDPGLGPVVLLDDRGRPCLERRGQAALEEVRRLNEVVVDRDHGHPHGPGLGVGQQRGPLAAPAPSRRLPREGDTIVSKRRPARGVRMTTQVEDVTTSVGLLIDGDVVAGGEGTYPVTNPARPAEVVLDAPSTSLGPARPGRGRSPPVPARLGRPSPPRSGRRRSWRPPRRAWPPSRPTTWPACSPASTARPTWRPSSTPPPWAAWRPPSRRWWPRRWRPAS